ncbi:MAG TPA: alpha/beta family hydrolase [Candidatus Limnocylindria bacterium]|nr:alpha/beta family hydrolase [Candidatus Limnocylindria bacterium]
MSATRIILAPGASGSLDGLRRHEAGLRQRGYDVSLIELPRGNAERAMPIYRAAVDDPAATAIGGQSFGGRVATLVAPEVKPAAVVCLSYPLHAPGRQDAWDERTEHWAAIDCPVLLLSGESDPFARLGLLRRAAPRLRHGRLVTYPGLGHSLLRVLDRALDEVAAFLAAET